jgi:hypothetical protein
MNSTTTFWILKFALTFSVKTTVTYTFHYLFPAFFGHYWKIHPNNKKVTYKESLWVGYSKYAYNAILLQNFKQ